MLRWKTATLVALLSVGVYFMFFYTPSLAHLLRNHKAYPVRVVRDRWGVPHIYSDTDAAGAFGLAFAQCGDNFLGLQQIILAARGQLSEMEGEDYLPFDWVMRFLRLHEQVRARFDLQPPTVKALCQGFADGLNHYAATHPTEVRHFRLWPATAADILAVFLARLYLELGVLEAVDGAVGGGMFDAEVRCPLQVDFSGVAVALRRQKMSGGGETPASTSLLINTHQPWTGISSMWYEAHVHSNEGWSFTGFAPFGSPVFYQGFSAHLGWALTRNHPNSIDIFELEMNSEGSHNRLHFRIDGSAALTLEHRQPRLWFSLLGPLSWFSDVDVYWAPAPFDAPALHTPRGVFVIKTISVDRIMNAMQQLFAMNLAKNFEQWNVAMRMHAIPCLNFIYADAQDTVAYTYSSILPIRPTALPPPQAGAPTILPGNSSELHWAGYYDFGVSCLQKVNPSSGWLMSADSTPLNLTVGDSSPLDGLSTAAPQLLQNEELTSRALRLLELLHADGRRLTEEDLVEAKFDERYAMGDRLVRLRNAVVAFAEQYLDRLQLTELERDTVEVAKWWNLGADLENQNTAICGTGA